MSKEELVYTLEEGAYLVTLARKSILHYLTFGEILKVPEDVPEKLQQNSGVFVTLNTITKEGQKELRGCIGYPLPIYPLVKATIEAAKSAAVNDPRFPTVEVEELKSIVIEVTILTPPKPLKVQNTEEYLERIKIGRDGLIVRRGGASGLLLPQVPVEWHWDVKEFLEHTCQKAWLSKDCWKDPQTEIQVFSGIIFHEQEPNGEVIQEEIS